MKGIPRFLFVLFFLSINWSICAQSTKGLYVNDFVDIIGDETAENDLLELAQSQGFNYLILYNLYAIHNTLFDITDPMTSTPLANFIEKAKTTYGILEVGAVGETFNSFTNIHDYNMDHSGLPLQQFDVYNIEFEYWNNALVSSGGYYCDTYLGDEGLSCDTSGAFTFLLENICDLKTLTDGFPSIKSEMYVGWPNAAHARKIANCTDRVLVHYYRTSDVYMSGNSIYNFGLGRLEDLAQSFETSVVMPIFNCRSAFMGPWLEDHSEDQAFDTWMNGMNGYVDDPGSWKSNNVVDGYVWYRYTCMPESAALPVQIKRFEKVTSERDSYLKWEIEKSMDLMSVELQASSDGSHFETIVFYDGSLFESQYDLSSEKDPRGFQYYRMKISTLEDEIHYSQILYDALSKNEITFSWNALNRQLKIHKISEKENFSDLRIFSLDGKLVLQKRALDGIQEISLSHLYQGFYYISIKSSNHFVNEKLFIH